MLSSSISAEYSVIAISISDFNDLYDGQGLVVDH